MGNNRSVTQHRLVSERVLVIGGILLSYGVGVAALTLAQATGTTAAWWPAAGVGVLTALAASPHRWPAVFAGLGVAFALANLTAGRSVEVSVLLGVADAAETAVVVALLIRYVGPRMNDVMDVWKLFAIATVGALVAGLGIALTYDLLLGASFWATMALVVPAHAAPVVLMTPIALLRRGTDRGPRRRAELLVQICLLVLTTAVTFGPSTFTLGFAPLPVLVWAAVRFSERVLVVEQILFATAATLLTQLDLGPFASLSEGDAGTSTQAAQLYLFCLALVGLPLARAMRQRDEAMAKVIASERVFRRNFTESRVPVAIVSRDYDELYFAECNAAAVDLLGSSSKDLSGLRVLDLLESRQLAEAARGIIVGSASGWSGTVGILGQPATRLDATLSLIEVAEDGATFSLHLVDVTEPMELAQRLQEERDYTRAVIDTASSMLVLTDRDGTVIAANPATTANTGFAEAELVGRPLWELLIAEDQRPGVVAAFAAPQGLPPNGEAQLQTRDGSQLAVIFSSDVHRVSADAPVTVVISATDVTAARQNAGMIDHLLRSARTIAFVGTDLTGRITLFNTGAAHMLGIDADEATGRPFVDFFSADELEHYGSSDSGRTVFDAIVDQAAGDLAPETRDWTWTSADRAPLKVSMTTNPVTDTFGALIGYLFVANDITDSSRSQEVLVRALRRERQVVARLKDLDRAKDDFVSTVSHELRTPMSSIIGSAEMLADGLIGELAPGQRRMIDVIARNGDRLLTLADDLLLLATFDHDTWPEQSTTVDLRTVVEESASSVASMLATRDVEVGYSLPGRPVMVGGDPTHLERAVTNLLTNGVKFTDDGGRVHVEVAFGEASHSASIIVRDTGMGIPAAEVKRIFGRFYRSTLVQERAIQGTGLGLSIVKQIVESHEGQVDVHSVVGQGTTFTITLPLVAEAVPAH